MKFISIGEVKQIHNMLIEEFGGAKGVRSEELLDSAVHYSKLKGSKHATAL